MRNALFTLEDLAIAYRKAKVDLYYGTAPRHLDIAAFERDLEENLSELVRRLNNDDGLDWIDKQFVGDIQIAPKSVDLSSEIADAADSTQHRIYSSPMDQWNAFVSEASADEESSDEARIQTNFRLISNCSIAMHVIGALWVREVGVHLDSLLSKSVRGYRVRRDREGRYNDWSLGTFEPYLWPYKKWRDDAFDALEEAIDSEKSVYCLVADATEFFHSVEPDFLQPSSEFFPWAVPELDVAEFFSLPRRARIHKVFLTALTKWQTESRSDLEQMGFAGRVSGLPVGFPPSGLVANLALLHFDRLIHTEVRPIHYGRYVDDIVLVWEDQSLTENDQRLESVSAAWEWIAAKFLLETINKPLLYEIKASDENRGSRFRFQPDYHGASRIDFSNDKNRLYSLHGSTGSNLLVTLRAAADRNSSEWRMMPELPYAASEVGALVSRARNADGDSADSLTNFEGISMSRSAFALTLRNFEAFARDIESNSWKKQRYAFYRAICDYVFVPSTVFDMDRYVTRVLSLALLCGDIQQLEKLIEVFIVASNSIEKVSDFRVAGIELANTEIRRKDEWRAFIRNAWLEHIKRTIYSAIDRSWRKLSSENHKRIQEMISELKSEWGIVDRGLAADGHVFVASGLDRTQLTAFDGFSREYSFEELFCRDLAGEPFRYSLLPQYSTPSFHTYQVQEFNSAKSPLKLFEGSDIKGAIVDYLDLLAAHEQTHRRILGETPQSDTPEGQGRFHTTTLKNGEESAVDLHSLWALLFPTRPFSTSELFDLSNILRARNDEVETAAHLLARALLVARGIGVQATTLRKIRPILEDDRHMVELSTEDPFEDGTETEVNPFTSHESSDVLAKTPPTTKGDNVRIAVSMLRTPPDFVTAAIHRKPNLSARRYNAVSRLVNKALKLNPRPDYLVLGELALPLQWYNYIAMKLAAANINLIAGVEYIPHDPSDSRNPHMRNQVWASLRHRSVGYPTHSIYKQDKLQAAHGERQNLVNAANAQIAPEFEWETPPILSHDGHSFGILICSELTNIDYRASLRGKVDTLFVPQWNQDLNTFTALVESAALDIHAYIVQVNNRIYGDTRIRVPAKKETWTRDLVRLKGGLNDYLVVGELDINKLRIFQTEYSSSRSDYKPLPDGYRQDARRKRL